MTEVTQDEFYTFIGPKDCVSSIIGSFPYTTIIKMRYGAEIARVVEKWTDDIPNNRPIITKFYINKQ